MTFPTFDPVAYDKMQWEIRCWDEDEKRERVLGRASKYEKAVQMGEVLGLRPSWSKIVVHDRFIEKVNKEVDK